MMISHDTRVPLGHALRAKIVRLTTMPVRMASVHLTDYCNSKCDFCVVNSPMVQVPIATQKLVDTVERLAAEHPDMLNIHGGEATISPALFPVLDAGRRHGIPEVHLQTNAIRLADRALVDRLMDAGVTVFVISLHGHDAATQETITRSTNSFDKIIRGIRNCIQAGALVRTNTVICRQNIDVLLEVLTLSCQLGVPWQNLSALHPSQHAMARFRELVVHPSAVRRVVPAAVQRLRIAYPDTVIELEGFAYCHAPGLESFHIDTHLRRIRMAYHDQIFEDYEAFMNLTQRRLEPQCVACSRAPDCNGIYHAYATEFTGTVVWPVLEHLDE